MQSLDGAPNLHLGRALFAGAMAGLGLLGLMYGDFALLWQADPQAVPRAIPQREALAYVCAVPLLACGFGLLSKATAAPAAGMLLLYLLLGLLLLRVPVLLTHPLAVTSWSGCGENSALLAGGWTLFAELARPQHLRRWRFATGRGGLGISRIVFAFALVACGVAHFAYAQSTAALVPAWLPWHLAWVYLTGGAFIAAGVAVLCRVYAPAAAELASGMMSAFTLLVWVPAVAAAPGERFAWTALFISSAITAAGWAVSDAYRAERKPGIRVDLKLRSS